MKTIKYITISIMVVILTSCQQELVYTPNERPNDNRHERPNDNRRLLELTEYLFPNKYYREGKTTILYKDPRYDDNGLITFAYCAFIGDEAYYSYSYNEDKIITTITRKDGEKKTREYLLKDRQIVYCVETNSNLTSEQKFEYKYSKEGKLSEIHVKYSLNDNSISGEYKVNIKWDNGNIAQVIQIFDSGAIQNYSYEYQYFAKYKPNFPITQHLMNIYIGGTQGIDDILMAEGYFGNSMSMDLPIKETYENISSNEFEYFLDEYGAVTTITQINAGKTIREYKFKWR